MGTPVVLVIDTHQSTRVELQRVLEKAGCVVVCAGDAADARRVLGTHVGGLDVAVVDEAVLEVDRDLLDAMRARSPGVRVVLTTDEHHRGGVPAAVVALRRPIHPADLTRVVVELGKLQIS